MNPSKIIISTSNLASRKLLICTSYVCSSSELPLVGSLVRFIAVMQIHIDTSLILLDLESILFMFL